MGFEDEVEQSFPRPCRLVQADMRTNLIHCPARDIILPLGADEFPPMAFGAARTSCRRDCLSGPGELAAPSTMRCIITARRRASATIALFLLRCLAIFIAQALSQDHFAECTKKYTARRRSRRGQQVGDMHEQQDVLVGNAFYQRVGKGAFGRSCGLR